MIRKKPDNDHHSSGLARVVQGGSTSDSDESDQVCPSSLRSIHISEINFGPRGLLDDPYLTLLTFQDFWQPYRPKLSPAKPQPPDTTELDQVRSARLYECGLSMIISNHNCG